MPANSKNLARERAFKTAQTHSRRVRRAKRILPIFALGVVGAIAAIVLVVRPSANVALNLPATTLSDGKLVMANPNLDGFTKDQRPFRVTAVRAIQDLAMQDALELDQLAADVELENGQLARLTSSMGTYNSNSNRLALPQQAQLTTSDGLQAIMGQADINIESGSVMASNSVKIINPESVITAKAMQIEDGGKRILFKDSVRFVMLPKSENSIGSDAQASQTVSNTPDAGIN